MLHEFITVNREEIIRRCRAKVASRSIPPPSEAEINHGVPLFLDQLVSALRFGDINSAEIDRTAGEHGHDLLVQGFTVSQVVHDYGDVCQTITDLAVETNAPIDADDFRTLNRCLDDAIAGAVTTYGRLSERRASIEQQREELGRSNERVGFMVHELRNLVSTALIAFEVIKTGDVGVSGSTGAVLNRSLIGLRDLIARSLEEVQMTMGTTRRKRVVVADFIRDVTTSATMAADARKLKLTVTPVEEGVLIDADEQVLAAVIGNLLQNAFKFTRPLSTVTLRVDLRADRVLIEVEDECGGLVGVAEGTGIPASFEQRNADKSGMGIGLAFCRWGAEANGGRLYVRNVPGKGCVFTIDLPKAAAPVAVPA